MATYAIGDVQGCFDELLALLKLIDFKPDHDELWFCGDLVNRGPKSLEVLRLVRELPRAKVVLGNHDLFLLALAENVITPKSSHTLDAVLAAPDLPELMQWLRWQDVLYYDPHWSMLLVHAGLAPQWDLATAQALATEVTTLLRGPHYREFLKQMYGETPSTWSQDLPQWQRVRFIINCLTMIRFCDRAGHIQLKYKGKAAGNDSVPWFAVPQRAHHNLDIIFGHWSALEGHTEDPHLFALDTGCVWGGSLTALRLEDKTRYHTPCTAYTPIK